MKPMNKRLTDLEAIKPRVKLDHSDWVTNKYSDDEILYSSGRHYFVKERKDFKASPLLFALLLTL